MGFLDFLVGAAELADAVYGFSDTKHHIDSSSNSSNKAFGATSIGIKTAIANSLSTHNTN